MNKSFCLRNEKTKNEFKARESAYIFDMHAYIIIDLQHHVSLNMKYKFLILEINHFLRELTARLCYKLIKGFQVPLEEIDDNFVVALVKYVHINLLNYMDNFSDL